MYKVLAVFTLPSELITVQSLLEVNGIESFAKDELTIQVHNFISNALGGIRLQVRNTDYETAKDILMENGYENYLASYEHPKFSETKQEVILGLKMVLRVVIVLSIVLVLYLFFMVLTK